MFLEIFKKSSGDSSIFCAIFGFQRGIAWRYELAVRRCMCFNPVSGFSVWTAYWWRTPARRHEHSKFDLGFLHVMGCLDWWRK